MIRIIFITILFLSSNVFAATYLVCKNYDNELNVKLGNKKISIKYKSEDYIDFSNKILKWNEELIELSHKENYLWERTRFENEFNDVEKHNCDNCRKTFKNDSFLCAHVCWLTEYVSQ